MLVKEFSPQKVWMARLDPGIDLMEALTGFIVENNITAGHVFVMGLVRKVRYAYYNIETNKYQEMCRSDQYLEIIQAAGNISIREDQPFAHVHIALGDSDGRIFGGHLLPGTIVEVGEVTIHSFGGPPMERVFDPKLNMAPWTK